MNYSNSASNNSGNDQSKNEDTGVLPHKRIKLDSNVEGSSNRCNNFVPLAKQSTHTSLTTQHLQVVGDIVIERYNDENEFSVSKKHILLRKPTRAIITVKNEDHEKRFSQPLSTSSNIHELNTQKQFREMEAQRLRNYHLRGKASTAVLHDSDVIMQ